MRTINAYFMKPKLALAVWSDWRNKNSFAALIGALEMDELFDELPIYFLRDAKKLKVEIGDMSKKYQKVVLAFSFSTFQAKEIVGLIKNLKKGLAGNVILLAGGPHSSGDPKGVLAAGFDFVVVGEGEKAVKDLLKALVLKKSSYKNIANLAYVKNGKFFFTFKNYANLNDYPPFAPKHKIFGPIEITRGCPWGCKYCQTSYLFGRELRHRSVSQVVKYAMILKNNNHKDIRFITPNALSYGSKDGKKVSIRAIENLLKGVRLAIGREGRIFFGSFPSEVRPDQVSQKALDMIKKYCNNKNLIVGAQSGSQRILDYICRGHKVGDIYQATKLIIKNGFKANVDFIFGLPGEQEEDVRKTFELMEDLINLGVAIHGHTFMPLVGTPFAKEKIGRLGGEYEKRLKRLENAGKVYGEWEKQASL